MPIDVRPRGGVHGELSQRRLQLDLRRHVADLVGELQRLLASSPRRRVVGLSDLEMAAQREQGPNGFARVGLPRQLHRPLEASPRLLEIADPAEDATEGEMGATGRNRLPERLRQALGLLGRVDREHVVAGLDVQRRRLLVELDQLPAGIAVLEQVDPLLEVGDRSSPVRLVPEARADLAVQLRRSRPVVGALLVVERLRPARDRGIDLLPSGTPCHPGSPRPEPVRPAQGPPALAARSRSELEPRRSNTATPPASPAAADACAEPTRIRCSSSAGKPACSASAAARPWCSASSAATPSRFAPRRLSMIPASSKCCRARTARGSVA